jgi:hypothetical protein
MLGEYLCLHKSSPKLVKYDFIVKKLSTVDYAISIVCKKHVLIYGYYVLNQSTYQSEIRLNLFSL